MFHKIGTVWCRLRHESLMWPVHGYYRCRSCGRRYPAFPEAPAVDPNITSLEESRYPVVQANGGFPVAEDVIARFAGVRN
jgi:hypothetical protein